MAHCLIVPFYLHVSDLRREWSRAIQRRSLIDLDLARAYFRPTVAHIDATVDPPVISEPQAYIYAKEA